MCFCRSRSRLFGNRVGSGAYSFKRMRDVIGIDTEGNNFFDELDGKIAKKKSRY